MQGKTVKFAAQYLYLLLIIALIHLGHNSWPSSSSEQKVCNKGCICNT